VKLYLMTKPFYRGSVIIRAYAIGNDGKLVQLTNASFLREDIGQGTFERLIESPSRWNLHSLGLQKGKRSRGRPAQGSGTKSFSQ